MSGGKPAIDFCNGKQYIGPEKGGPGKAQTTRFQHPGPVSYFLSLSSPLDQYSILRQYPMPQAGYDVFVREDYSSVKLAEKLTRGT